MTALPSASKMLSAPGDSVIRLVCTLRRATPSVLATRFGRSPMWNGWFASGFDTPNGPGSKCPPAVLNRGVVFGSHAATSWMWKP
jgi:hypothetical protein